MAPKIVRELDRFTDPCFLKVDLELILTQRLSQRRQTGFSLLARVKEQVVVIDKPESSQPCELLEKLNINRGCDCFGDDVRRIRSYGKADSLPILQLPACLIEKIPVQTGTTPFCL